MPESHDGETRNPFAPGVGTLATLVVVAMFNVMGGAAVSPALPAMGEAFPHASETAISLVITLPPLAVAISGLFLGGFGLANIAGSLVSAPVQARVARSALVAGCFVALAAGCAFMALAPGMWAVLAGAALIGIGVGCVTPVLMNWVASTSTPENSGKRMGALAMACNLGQFSCTLLSGAILALGGDHPAVFAVSGGIAIAGAVAATLARRLLNSE